MSRLTIEIPDEMHKQIKAMAALSGQNIKEFVLERLEGKPRHASKSAEKVKKPSKQLLRAFEDVKKGRVTRYNNVEEMFASWRKEDLL